MSKRSKNIVMAAVVALVLALAVLQLRPDVVTGTRTSAAKDIGEARRPPSASRLGSPTPRLDEKPKERRRATRLYAIATTELEGLPPQAPPGTRLEIWVTWEPPLTGRPRLQRLLPEVTLEEIISPMTPGGPAAAMLRVETSRLRDLLYADRYGSLSATVLPSE